MSSPPNSSSIVIHESSTHASPTLSHFLLATLIPTKHRIRIGSSMERYAPAGSLTRAVLAWGTTVGVGLLLLKVFGNNNNNNTTTKSNHHGRMVQEEEDEESRNFSLRKILSKMLGIKTDNNINRTSRTSRSSSTRKKNGGPPRPTPKSLFPPYLSDHDADEDEEEDVVHQGSCHCGAITFEVNAPRCLTLRFPHDENNDNGCRDGCDNDVDASFDLASVVSPVRRLQGPAILYPSAKVEANCFRLLSGQEQWKTYHVQVRRPQRHDAEEEDDDDNVVVVTKAYSFCRVCACHLLHASDDDAFSISINVHTLTTPWTRSLDEGARDVYNDDEEEEDFNAAAHRRHTTVRSPSSSRSPTRKQQPQKNKSPPPPRRRQQQQQRHQSRQQQQQQQPTSSSRRIVTPQQEGLADTATSSSYMIANIPLSADVDWPMVDDDDHQHHDDHDNAECSHYGGGVNEEEEASTIGSTTTASSSSPLRLDGTETTATNMSTSSTMTPSVVAAVEQQQQQQPRDAAAAASAVSSHTTADLVTREKLRQYMAKHMMKKNKTITATKSSHFQD